jgi:hypothetical protein
MMKVPAMNAELTNLKIPVPTDGLLIIEVSLITTSRVFALRVNTITAYVQPSQNNILKSLPRIRHLRL